MVRLVRSKVATVRRWLLSLPPVLAVAVVLAFAIFALTGMYGSYRLYSYTQDDPLFCRSCHTMQKAWDRWASSAHNQVNCHTCHESNALESFEQVVKFAASRPNEVAKHAKVPEEVCMSCHEGNDPRWIQVADTAGHKVHAEEKGISCLKCHSTSLHEFAPPEKVCLTCHTNNQVKMTGMAQRYCTDCHNYLQENSPLRPTRKDCLDCHERLAKKDVHWPSDAPMQLQCSSCHKPHEDTSPKAACQTCHQGQEQKGKHAVAAHQASGCTSCHEPHKWRVTDRETCTTCHQNRVEHNPGTTCSSCHGFRG